jgi:hypothetical protein
MNVEQRRLSDDTVVDVHEEGANGDKSDRSEIREIREVRATDIEPYTGLRYLSKLFRFMAIILVLLLIAEVATGIYTQGSAAIPTLLGEASRLVVLAGVLWGTGDLAHLLIDVGHDVRAARILVARVSHAKLGPTQSTAPRMARERPAEVVARADRPLADRRPDLTDNGDKGGPPIP